MIQVSNWSKKKCNKKSWLQALICTYFYVHSCKNAQFMAIFVKHTCSKKTSTCAKPAEHRFELSTGCSLKYMCGVRKIITHKHKIHLHTPKFNGYLKHKLIWNTPHTKPIHVSMILWTCPQKCGHYLNTNFICTIAVVHTRQNTHIGCFLWYTI